VQNLDLPHLLLVNDTDFLLMGFAHQLCPYFNIHTALDGQEAVDLFNMQEPGFYQAVVLDINMPRMNGIEAAKRILKKCEDQPEAAPFLYFLSGDGLEFVKDDIKDIPYAGYFSKLGLQDEIKMIVENSG
jgi:CheY-like chemotaxis protein